MLNADTKRHIDAARDVLVGVAPNPMTQIDQITYALIYKFMDDMDQAAIKAGGEPSFFTGELEPYAWSKLVDSRMGNQEKMNLYGAALQKFAEAKQLPELFRTIFRAAFLPYRSPETLGLFLKEINFFDYTHPEELGNAYEYLLSIMSAQGDAGQFRTPRHIIDFIVDVINPAKDDKVLDPACGTGGFLVASYNHILEQHDGKNDPSKQEKPLTPDERKRLMNNFEGYDIDPSMVRIAQVNMYLHQFKNPKIVQYDSLTSEERWSDKFDVILANPPFMSPKGGIKPHNKFALQSNRSEVLFVDYIANHLKPNGRAGIIVPEGIIFQSGKAYKQLRKELVEGGLYAVVSLPSGVFNPYSGVKTSILFINNEIAKHRDEILFVKILADGYDLGATKRPIEKNDLPTAIEALAKWKDGNRLESNICSYVSKSELLDSSDVSLAGDRYKSGDTFNNSDHESFLLSELESMGVLELGRGQIISKLDLEQDKGSYPVYSSSATGVGEFGKYGKFMFDEELITWSVDGGGRFFHRPHHRFSVTNVSGWMRIKDLSKLSYKYLYYVLDHQWKTLEFDYVAKAHPSVIRELYRIPLPPLEVQEQIVAELDGYAAIIDGAKKIVENWKPRIDVSADWPLFKLGDLCAVITKGTTPTSLGFNFTESGVNFVKVESITGNGKFIPEKFAHISNECHETLSRSQLREGDVLFSIAGALGRTAVVHKEILPANINQALAILRLKSEKEVFPQFLEYLLQTNITKHQSAQSTTGVAQQNISLGQLSEYTLPIPSLDVQQRLMEKMKKEESFVTGANLLAEENEVKSNAAIAKLWTSI
jgi:type I restriction enzyme M protein